MNRRGQRVPAAAGGGALFTVCFARSLLSGFGTHDEAWFLQVLDRVSRGEVLYRDVFFGVTPLSVQVLRPLVRVTGSEVLLLRAVGAATTTAGALVSCRAARRLGVDDPELLGLLALAVTVYGEPLDRTAPYSGLAALAQMACFDATIRAMQERGASRPPTRAAWTAGICFALKHSTGLATLAALSASLRPWRHPRAAATPSLAFLAAALGPLLPVVARGGGGRFADFALTNKRRYLRAAGISYLDGARALYEPALPPLRYRYATTKFLVPPLAALTLAPAALRGPREARVLAAFLLASVSGVLPRADEQHVSWTTSPALLALTWRAGRGRGGRRWLGRAGRTATWIWLGVGLAASFAKPIRLWRERRARICDLAHFRGIVESDELLEQVRAKAAALRDAAVGATLILAPDAAQYYLLSDIRNPTAYDYPLATAFGRNGEDEAAAAVRRGEISSVLLVPPPDERLSPRKLIEAVRDTMTPLGEIGGTFYRRTPVEPAGIEPATSLQSSADENDA